MSKSFKLLWIFSIKNLQLLNFLTLPSFVCKLNSEFLVFPNACFIGCVWQCKLTETLTCSYCIYFSIVLSEINRVRHDLFSPSNFLLSLPPQNGPIVKLTEKIYAPVKEYPKVIAFLISSIKNLLLIPFLNRNLLYWFISVVNT